MHRKVACSGHNMDNLTIKDSKFEIYLKGKKDKYNSALGVVIKRKREAAGMSQTRLAEYLGVGKSTISRYEYGTVDIPAYVLPMIADILGFRMEEYLDSLKNWDGRYY